MNRLPRASWYHAGGNRLSRFFARRYRLLAALASVRLKTIRQEPPNGAHRVPCHSPCAARGTRRPNSRERDMPRFDSGASSTNSVPAAHGEPARAARSSRFAVAVAVAKPTMATPPWRQMFARQR